MRAIGVSWLERVGLATERRRFKVPRRREAYRVSLGQSFPFDHTYLTGLL